MSEKYSTHKKKYSTKVLNYRMPNTKNLTKRQKEVLRLKISYRMGNKDIASRLKITPSAVSHHIQAIKKKGIDFDSLNNHSTFSDGMALIPLKGQKLIRLHNLEFKVEPFFFSDRYHKKRKKLNKGYLRGCTYLMHQKSIRIFSSEGVQFIGRTPQEATTKAQSFFDTFFRKLEKRLNIGIIKPDKLNIKQCNGHYSEIGNEIATECEVKKAGFKVVGGDGKVWFHIDNSFNLKEAEFVHPTESPVDAERMVNVFNDYRNNPSLPLPSEVYRMLSLIVGNQNTFAQNLASHVQAIQELIEVSRDIKGFLNAQRQRTIESQSKLLKRLITGIKTEEDIKLYKPYFKKLSDTDYFSLLRHIDGVIGNEMENI